MTEALLESKLKLAGSPTRCPYCHDHARVEESVACAACLARHHGGCWEELSACAACGQSERLIPEARPALDPARARRLLLEAGCEPAEVEALLAPPTAQAQLSATARVVLIAGCLLAPLALVGLVGALWSAASPGAFAASPLSLALLSGLYGLLFSLLAHGLRECVVEPGAEPEPQGSLR